LLEDIQMPNQDTPQRRPLGDPAIVARLTTFFTRANEVLETTQSRVGEHEARSCDVVFPLLHSIADANRSVLLLAANGSMRGCYVMARVSFEAIVNTCFILCQGEDAAERARCHARQKAFRDLDREIDINGMGFRLVCTAKDERAADMNLQESVAMFTSKKGREITQWTEENVQQRIEAIDRRHGLSASRSLMFALFSIYRHGSEIAHGSLFGALYSLGLTLPGGPRTAEELDRFRNSSVACLLWFLGKSIDSLVYVLEQELGITGFNEITQNLIATHNPRD
jgi:hypothetical protein